MIEHTDALTGTLMGTATSLGLATGAVTVPDGAPWWAGYIATLAVALAPVLLKLLLGRTDKVAPSEAEQAAADLKCRLDNAEKLLAAQAERDRAAREPSASAPTPIPTTPEVKQ